MPQKDAPIQLPHTRPLLEPFLIENALGRTQAGPPPRGVDFGKNDVFSQNDALKHRVFQKQNALADEATCGDSQPQRDAAVLRARQFFPRGLVQPEGAYRFSADALALSRFALACLPEAPDEVPLAADLGTGCGVVGLAMLLAGPEKLAVVGVEREPVLVAAARENALRLGLEERFSVVEGDVAELCAREAFAAGNSPAGQNEPIKSFGKMGDWGKENLVHKVSFPQKYTANQRFPQWLGGCSLVAANPPWRLCGTCRISPLPLRRAALVGDEATFPAFAGAAKAILRAGGVFAVCVGSERLGALEEAVRDAGMAVERVCRAHGKFAFVACRRV